MVVLYKDKNIRYIVDILDIDNNRHDINNQQSFEGKIGKKIDNIGDISPIYRYWTDISVVRHTRGWEIFFIQIITDISAA